MKATRWRHAALAACLATALVGAWPALADAKVVIGQGIHGAKLGDTRAEVQHLLGKGEFCSDGSCFYPALVGRVTFDRRGRVDDIWTSSCKQRLAGDIHIACRHGKGSSLAQIKHAYPRATCSTLAPRTDGTCELFSRYRGRRVKTAFEVNVNQVMSTTSGLEEIQISYSSSAATP